MANRFAVEPAKLLSTLKETAFKGATDAQMMALCVVAEQYQLNPFTREIYAFPDRKSAGIVPVIGVDGWYRLVNAHPEFDGCEFVEERDSEGKLVSTTCTMHRKDRSHPTRVTELLAECKRNTDPWNGQPSRMLRHRAFIQAARVAFGLSGADPEDAERTAPPERNVTPIFNRQVIPVQDDDDQVPGVAVTPAPEPAKKPGRPKKAEVAATTEEPAAEPFALEAEAEIPDGPPLERIEALRKRDGFTEAEVLAGLAALALVADEKTLAEVNADSLTEAADYWPEVAKEIAAIREGGAA